MAKFWRTKQFEAEESKWNEILKRSGFQDIEENVGGERVLKHRSDYAFRAGKSGDTALRREAKLTYYTLLAQHLERETNFADEFDRLIMEKTALGLSINEISIELRALLPKGRQRGKHNRNTIRHVRRRYEHKWGIKSWKPEEMVPKKARTR
jgi:hypothetical protein